MDPRARSNNSRAALIGDSSAVFRSDHGQLHPVESRCDDIHCRSWPTAASLTVNQRLGDKLRDFGLVE
jgi:hypothetical protein